MRLLEVYRPLEKFLPINFKFRLSCKRKQFSSCNNPYLRLQQREIGVFLSSSGKATLENKLVCLCRVAARAEPGTPSCPAVSPGQVLSTTLGEAAWIQQQFCYSQQMSRWSRLACWQHCVFLPLSLAASAGEGQLAILGGGGGPVACSGVRGTSTPAPSAGKDLLRGSWSSAGMRLPSRCSPAPLSLWVGCPHLPLILGSSMRLYLIII